MNRILAAAAAAVVLASAAACGSAAAHQAPSPSQVPGNFASASPAPSLSQADAQFARDAVNATGDGSPSMAEWADFGEGECGELAGGDTEQQVAQTAAGDSGLPGTPLPGGSDITNAQYGQLAQLAAQDICPQSATASPSPAAPQTLLKASGSGNTNTATFTVDGSGSGDYDISWSYTDTSGDGCAFGFDGENIDGSSDQAVNGPNTIGPGGSGTTHTYNDAGTHYLSVNTDCSSWTIKVVTAP